MTIFLRSIFFLPALGCLYRYPAGCRFSLQQRYRLFTYNLEKMNALKFKIERKIIMKVKLKDIRNARSLGIVKAINNDGTLNIQDERFEFITNSGQFLGGTISKYLFGYNMVQIFSQGSVYTFVPEV